MGVLAGGPALSLLLRAPRGSVVTRLPVPFLSDSALTWSQFPATTDVGVVTRSHCRRHGVRAGVWDGLPVLVRGPLERSILAPLAHAGKTRAGTRPELSTFTPSAGDGLVASAPGLTSSASPRTEAVCSHRVAGRRERSQAFRAPVRAVFRAPGSARESPERSPYLSGLQGLRAESQMQNLSRCAESPQTELWALTA